MIRYMVTQLLATLGYTVELVKNGADGMAAFAKSAYGIVVVDYQLPDMTGIEICRKLHDLASSLPLAVVPGQGKASTYAETPANKVETTDG